MADTCIVCLGELIAKDSLPSATGCDNHLSQFKNESYTSGNPESSREANLTDTIAYLLPCRHYFHNECLKPWVDRANSCPICRQTFQEVQLKTFLEGPCISSYLVPDKQQVADADPSLTIEDDFDEQSLGICLLCEEQGNDDLLLLCDGCNSPCHTYCVRLPEVPAGAWFCPFCQEESTNSELPSRRNLYRTRNDEQHTWPRRNQLSDPWARVWQSVWDGLNFDLDFAFDAGESIDTTQRNNANKREFIERYHRVSIVERQGVAACFRDAADSLLDVRSRQVNNHVLTEGSGEELRAWNAFDKARELRSGNSTSVRQKRKSPTASPSEPQAEPERRLKRPCTRRTPNVDQAGPSVMIAAPFASVNATACPISSLSASDRSPEAKNTNPGFFQTLLKEVETSSPNYMEHCSLSLANSMIRSQAPTEQSLAQPTHHSTNFYRSTNSINHPQPKALSSDSQASSPSVPLVVPRDGESLELSGKCASKGLRHTLTKKQQTDTVAQTSYFNTRINQPNLTSLHKNFPSLHSNKSSSSSRDNMSFTFKTEIQEMVKTALKPAYRRKLIGSDQYTKINREVSRRLYNRVGEAGGIHNAFDREKWQGIAKFDVDAAVNRAQGE